MNIIYYIVVIIIIRRMKVPAIGYRYLRMKAHFELTLKIRICYYYQTLIDRSGSEDYRCYFIEVLSKIIKSCVYSSFFKLCPVSNCLSLEQINSGLYTY